MTEPTKISHAGISYTGRFAPSPSGPLHFGSLVTALASWLDARAAGGRWLLRIEDVDAPRTVPGAEAAILADLSRHGLHWDGEVLRQSQRLTAYETALAKLHAGGRLYACTCSRARLAAGDCAHGPAGRVYPGFCRTAGHTFTPTRALRLRIDDDETIGFVDALQGRQRQHLGREVGDYVLRRADGLVAYALAVVVDDGEQAVTHVVRGADLLASTPRQIFLQRLLSLPQPQYLHLPLATDARGDKLSKLTHAPALPAGDPRPALREALAFLGQPPVPDGWPLGELLAQMVRSWQRQSLPAMPARVWATAIAKPGGD